MAWTWLLSLAPAADEIIGLITKKHGNGKKNKELQAEVSKKFASLFQASIKDANNDIQIISSWKNLIAPIQAINTVVVGWELVIDLAMEEKNPALAFKVIKTKNIEKLNISVSEISKHINKITAERKISWRDSAVDIESQFENMLEDIKALMKMTKRFEQQIKEKKEIDADDLFHLNHEIGDIKQKILTILNYWDAFIKDLVNNLSKAPTTFVKGLPGISDFAIKAKYDETKWKDIFEKTYQALDTSTSEET